MSEVPLYTMRCGTSEANEKVPSYQSAIHFEMGFSRGKPFVQKMGLGELKMILISSKSSLR